MSKEKKEKKGNLRLDVLSFLTLLCRDQNLLFYLMKSGTDEKISSVDPGRLTNERLVSSPHAQDGLQ